MRTRAAVDSTQKQIVAALRQAGATVQHLHTVGRGCPDLLVGFKGRTHLLEVKDGRLIPSRRRLTDDEKKWHLTWSGEMVRIVECQEDALAAIGVSYIASVHHFDADDHNGRPRR